MEVLLLHLPTVSFPSTSFCHHCCWHHPLSISAGQPWGPPPPGSLRENPETYPFQSYPQTSLSLLYGLLLEGRGLALTIHHVAGM